MPNTVQSLYKSTSFRNPSVGCSDVYSNRPSSVNPPRGRAIRFRLVSSGNATFALATKDTRVVWRRKKIKWSAVESKKKPSFGRIYRRKDKYPDCCWWGKMETKILVIECCMVWGLFISVSWRGLQCAGFNLLGFWKYFFGRIVLIKRIYLLLEIEK